VLGLAWAEAAGSVAAMDATDLDSPDSARSLSHVWWCWTGRKEGREEIRDDSADD